MDGVASCLHGRGPHHRAMCVSITPDVALRAACNNSQHQVLLPAAVRQLRRVPRSLDRHSTATLLQAFVTSRIDYCNSLCANALRKNQELGLTSCSGADCAYRCASDH